MSHVAEVRGLELRLAKAERDALAWKESALTEVKGTEALRETLLAVRYERNLLRRERAAIWRTVRDVVDGGGDVADLLDLLASVAQPLRDGEGLLGDGEEGDHGSG